jgi:hypothetical protein
VAVVVALGLAPRVVLADDDQGSPDAGVPATDDAPAPNPAEARRWMAAGDSLMKKGDSFARRGKTADAQSQYERALLSYTKAFELSTNPQLYYAIAVAEERLGKQADALVHYRRVTQLVTTNPELVELATQRLGALSAKLGLFTATVEPAGAVLSIDGNPIGTAPMEEPAVLVPGTYTLVVTADGYHPLEIKLEIEAGSESVRTFKLESVAVMFEKPKEAPRPVSEADRPRRPSRLVLWIGGGVTLALAGVATTTGALALTRHNTFVDPAASPAARDSARKSGKTLSVATDVCLIGAVAAAAFTTYWYFGVHRPRLRSFHRKTEEQRGEVAVIPWIQSSTGGVAVAVTY